MDFEAAGEFKLLSEAVVLFSGGVDCAILATYLLSIGIKIVAVEIDYPSRDADEKKTSELVSKHLGIEKYTIELRSENSGRLAPPTQAILLSLAEGCGFTASVSAFFLGVIKDDWINGGSLQSHAFYLRSMERILGYHRDFPVRLYTPFIDLMKEDVIKLGARLGAPLHVYKQV